MIQSILDTDLYKFSTSYAYFKLYPYAEGTFKFCDRNKEDWRGTNFLDRMRNAVDRLIKLELTSSECGWCINNISYIPKNYWEWLKTFRFVHMGHVNMWLDENGVFQCEVTDLMYKVTLWEIAILATYAELRNEVLGIQVNLIAVSEIIDKKIEFADANELPFSEFGTRRRFSSVVQNTVCQHLQGCNSCAGTSNVHYARLYNFKPIGTFPHEWVMFHAAIFGYKRANYLSLEDWIDVYDGNLGTALIDTYTTKSFLHTLTRKQAHLLSGFRQDSGDEFEVGEMIIKRLEEFGIDPKSKLIVFSNALNFEKAAKIYEYFKDRIKVSFGIGTNLTCDIGDEGFKPANIVMKLSKARLSNKDPWGKCLKISDDAGKHMGDETEFDIAQYELHL